jgi:NAD(P)H-hydrate epimerase
MMDSHTRRRLIELLGQTGTEHHHAYQATDGADPDWPLWYAEHMQASFNALLGTALTRSELTYLLVWAEKEHMAQAAGTAWPEHYADFILERAGRMAEHMPAAPRM